MSTKIKYTEKDLKQPDEFNKTVGRIVDFTSDHAKKILIAVVVVIVVLVGAFFINTSSQNQGIEANNMFQSAMNKLDSGDTEGALAGFLELEKEHPNSGVSNVALYYAAMINFNEGNYQESLSLLDRFKANETDEPMLVDSAKLTQGLAYFNQNEWQKAIDYLSEITEPQSPYLTIAKMHMALSYEQLGDSDRATAIYYQINQAQPGLSTGFNVETKGQDSN
ncbi:MAG: tetratricopeptide repeat protein [Thermodesulfobacteriota bacterium]